MNIRKNAALLTTDEKKAFIEAIIKFKKEGNPATGRNYDTFVAWHQASIYTEENTNGFWSFAHGCPAFLPWHRKYLALLEQDLQAVSGNPELTIPYWDIGADDADSVIWTPDFMGGNGDEGNDWKVQDGPFAFNKGDWILNLRNINVEPDGALRRAFGVAPQSEFTLPNADVIVECIAMPVFDIAPWNSSVEADDSFRAYLEGRRIHGIGHVWTGGIHAERGTIGSMANVYTSPNDPVFFLHHANVDRIWAKWQQAHPNLSYLPEEPLEGVPGAGKHETMPFGQTIESVLDMSAMEYEYDLAASDDQVTPFIERVTPERNAAPFSFI